ncbi:MAG: bifunctional metallophosphatase/5'-nucleotidase [Deltaproteobacteria bacterium]|nr:bifunctional metallophosphatase/5'-nucleotidase [Deltaproteobacteria bacterium]
MKTTKLCLWAGIVVIALMLGACKFGNVSMTIMQTSDIHHHASGYGPFLDYTPLDTSDADSVKGGYARLAAKINAIRQEQSSKNIPVLLFDSGDFFMGTVYDLTAADPVALKFFSLMGYDAITLGNHEFDWSPSGLALLLSNAMAGGFDVPVVATNTVIPADNELQLLVNAGAIVNKKIIDMPCGVKVGVLGLMGPDSDEKAPVASPVTFNHDYAFIQQQVNELRCNDGVKVVIVLSHGGVETDGTGDDADLAENVHGIDIIASGHFHTATHDMQVCGQSGTIIFSPGEYGEYLSRLDLTYNIFLRKIVDVDFTLIPIDDTIEGDPIVQGMVEMYHAAMNATLTENLGLQLDTPVSTTTFALQKAPLQVTGIGSLAADSLRTVASSLSPLNDGNAYDVGIVASGVIRDDIYPGNTGIITFSDVYNMLPLGISPNDQSVPGYPLMSVYATGMDLYTICEVGLSLSRMMGSDYYLNFSGLRIDYDLSQASTFSGVQAVYLYPSDDTFCMTEPALVNPYDPDTLYHIVVDLYALQMLNVVNSYGFDINPIEVSFIDRSIDEGVQEIKEWMAPLNFMPYLGGSIPSFVYGPEGIALDRVNYVTH